MAAPPFPDFAEPAIGPATSGRTRWLNPGYNGPYSRTTCGSSRKFDGVTNTIRLAITMVPARK
jgi:hypothetical protein